MSAQELRQAAVLMRERAEVATPGPWAATIYGVFGEVGKRVAPWDEHSGQPDMDNRLHIASWDPAVTVLVADWLDVTAVHIENHDCEAHCESRGCGLVLSALTLARAYLGSES